MEGTGQSDEAAPPAAADRELHECSGAAKGQLEQLAAARARLAALLQQKLELERQCKVAGEEVVALQRDLHGKLSEWCALDELDQSYERLSGGITRMEEVRHSLTYRAALGVLLVVNRLRTLVTLGWRRRRSAGRPDAP